MRTEPVEGVTEERAPYGRRSRREGKDRVVPPRVYEGQTYYGRPALKTPHYRWLVASYLFVGGLAGAAQLIATAADLFGRERDRPAVRAGRYLALAGAVASPVLLIADIQTKARWYNMLRIFRGTSAMSIGSWTLPIFGGVSGLIATTQAVEDLTGTRALRPIGTLLAPPAVATGAVMSCYTGTLLASSSIPLWAAAWRRLPVLFALSAAATALSAISLLVGTRSSLAKRLGLLALGVSVAEAAVEQLTESDMREREVAGPLEEPGLPAALYRVGAVGAGTAAPLLLRGAALLPGTPRALSTMASLLTLAGGFALRASLLLGGRESAERPRDVFRFTQESR